jgi:hypothetical protein
VPLKRGSGEPLLTVGFRAVQPPKRGPARPKPSPSARSADNVTDLLRLAVAAELGDDPSAYANVPSLDAFGLAHERLERGDERFDVVNGRQNAVVPSVMVISAALDAR